MNYKDIDEFIKTNYLREILENLPLSFAILDTEFKYVFFNKKWMRPFSEKNEENYLGQSIFDLHDNLLINFKRYFENALKGHISKGKNFINIEGKLFCFKWEILPIKSNDCVIGILIVAQDTTEETNFIVRTQKKIKDLMQINNELEKFCYACAHDLKEPLRAISNFIYFIENELDNSNNSNNLILNYLNLIKKNILKLRKLINDLLQLASLTMQRPDFSLINLNLAVSEAKDLLAANIANTDVEIIVENLPDIRASKIKIQSLIQNLISNSIKYKSKDKLKIIIGYEDLGDKWKFHIKDNGIGIDYGNLSKIFDPFEKYLPTKDHEGAGLGLYICKKIIDEHNGEIWVESEKEKGSTFYFTIPKNI